MLDDRYKNDCEYDDDDDDDDDSLVQTLYKLPKDEFKGKT
jgi:hypothetical protein